MFTDIMSEGFIAIDNEGKIQVYNKKAREIFGISVNDDYEISHDEGQIQNGDIVIIANNDIGKDDGNMDGESLELLGIRDKNIQQEDAIIGIGIFNGDGEIDPIYKILKKEHGEDYLKLEESFLDIQIEAEIDFINRSMKIVVEDKEFQMNYISAIGHMVILDGMKKNLKFYQGHGYTARRESINEILSRKSYRAKGENKEVLNVIGEHIYDIHKSDYIIEQFFESARGKNIKYTDKFEEINGYPTICSLIHIEDKGERVGAALKVEDISELERLMDERDELTKDLKKIEEQLLEEDMLKKAFPNFVGTSKSMQIVKRMALKAAKTNSNVLILGASGTGKTILGRAIHKNSKLRDKPFVHVNCGAIPDSLLESELFGYEKGAFTGARSEGKKGFFEIAEGGTILLDEIGDIPQNLQVKLLQVIQEKCFYRVGGVEEIESNVRIITATNKNLEEEMTKGEFREDLFYRINVFPISIPELKDRKEDITPLVNLLLPRICREIGCEEKRISSEAMNLIQRYDWPGNVRELENILERAVNLASGRVIMSRHITLEFNRDTKSTEGVLPLRDFLEKQEKTAIKNALDFYQGNRKKTMDALEISKTNLYEKLKKYNID